MPSKVTFPATFPLSLGEHGRGRVSVTVHHRPRAAGGAALVAVKTDRSYTRYRRSGELSYWGGAMELARGAWAHGDAGRIASGPDVLLALQVGSRAAFTTYGGDGVREYFYWDGAELLGATAEELEEYSAPGGRAEAEETRGEYFDTLLRGCMALLMDDADTLAPRLTRCARAVGLGPSQVGDVG